MERTLQLNPLNKAALWDDIKSKRDEFEQSPISTVSFGDFDADEISVLRMKDAVEQFDVLPTLVDSKLTWKRADNSLIQLTKAELNSVYEEIKQKRSIRSAMLHVKAEEFRLSLSAPTKKEINEISFWGISI